MNKKDFFMSYDAPQVEVIEVEVEKGFCDSNEFVENEDLPF